MKKALIIFFSILFLLPVNTYAESDWLHEDKIADHSYLAVCSYTIDKTLYAHGKKASYDRINIYYSFKDKNWGVSWGSYPRVTKDNDKFGSYDKVFSKSGKNVHISSETKNKLEAKALE